MRRIVNKVLMSVGGWTFLRNAAIFSVAILVMAYSSAEAKPSKAEFKDALSRKIPKHFKLNDFSTEASQNLGNEVDPVWAVRFNATIQTLSDLYVHDRTENNVYFVSRTTKKDTKTKVFGKIKSELYQGKWRYYVSFDGNPVGNLGIPLNQYGGRPVIRGSKQESEYFANIQRERVLQKEVEEKRRADEKRNQMVRENRQNAEVYYKKGHAAKKNEQLDEAISYFSKAIEIDGNYAKAYELRGVSFHLRGEIDKAMKDYTKSEELAPDMESKSWANYAIAEIYNKKGDFKSAEKYYNKSIDLGPGRNYYIFDSTAWFYATCKNNDFRDGQKAIKYATEACIMSEWHEPSYINTLAAAFAEAGKFDDAVRTQQKAIALVEAEKKQDYTERMQMYMNKQKP